MGTDLTFEGNGDRSNISGNGDRSNSEMGTDLTIGNGDRSNSELGTALTFGHRDRSNSVEMGGGRLWPDRAHGHPGTGPRCGDAAVHHIARRQPAEGGGRAGYEGWVGL